MSIITTFLRALRLVGAYTVANVQAAMEYRVSFWVQIITMIANDSLWLFFWWTSFHQFTSTHGWQATDIIILWAISACGFGLSMGIFGNARYIASLIMNGGLDAYLGMPRYALLHICIATSDTTAWGDIIFALGAFVLFVHPGVWHIVLFVLLALQVGFSFTAFLVILCSLAFFLGNTEGLAQQLLGALVSFTTYPLTISSCVEQCLRFPVVPAGLVSFFPPPLLHTFTWPLLGGMVGFTLLIVSVAVGVFERGLRRYESGNLLGMQN